MAVVLADRWKEYVMPNLHGAFGCRNFQSEMATRIRRRGGCLLVLTIATALRVVLPNEVVVGTLCAGAQV